ncbi:BamA/TamA family outer membrane protein [Marinobacter hydrocarbonoclasticus]|nr:BamA/TamA family outer membrane protein [Marinobacter nauticus]
MASPALAADNPLSLPLQPNLEDAKALLDDLDNRIEQLEEKLDSTELDPQQQAQLSQALNQLEAARKPLIQKQGLPMFTLLGGPGYAPEIGGLLAIGGLYSFSTDRTDPTLQRSSVGGFFIVNKGDGDPGFAVRSTQSLFFADNALRYQGEVRAGTQSTHYWGVGQEAGDAQDASDDTLMRHLSIEYRGTLAYRVLPDLYVGPSLNISYFRPDDEELPPSAIEDENFQVYQDRPLSMGLGLSLQWDTRDVAVNAREGQYLNLEYLLYRQSLGSDNDFDSGLLDYRYYHAFAPGRVLASYNALQWAEGDVPYYAMPKLGGMRSMRGIYHGRYRDQYALEHTLEYRHTFRRADGSLSNHGMVGWAGIGFVAADFSGLYQNALSSFGVGYRYEIQPRMNVRLDLGISADDKGFYFNFTEAF